MKIRTAILAGVLAITSVIGGVVFSRRIHTGYNVGLCFDGSFAGSHIEISKEEIEFTDVSLSPHKVTKLEEPTIYRFSKADADGRHYTSNELEIVIHNTGKEISGSLYSEGQPVGVLTGSKADVSSLAADSMKEFKACQALLETRPPEPPSLH